jgi:methionine aminotransferase
MSHLAVECGAINLGQGFPDFKVDPELIRMVSDAMKSGHNQYAPLAGTPMLRERLCAKAETLYGHAYDPIGEITVTAGATQAIFTAIQSVVHEGDEVIIIDPAYDCYAPAVKLCGGVPVHVKLRSDLTLDTAAVVASITPDTRMLMINTPHNPGGRIIRHEDMVALEQALDGTNILLLSDEVYEHLIFDQEQHCSAIRYPGLRERSFVVFSFGKVFHATGWKMGYVFAPTDMMVEFRKVHQYNVFCVNSAVQVGLAEYLVNEQHYLSLPDFFQPKRDLFLEGLQGSGFAPMPCEGSYFMVVDYSALSDKPDTEFAEWLTREHGVASIPLSPFYAEPDPAQRLVRLCFAKQEKTLESALKRLQGVK